MPSGSAGWASTTPQLAELASRTAGGGTSGRSTGRCSTGSQRSDRRGGPGSCPTPARALASTNATTASRAITDDIVYSHEVGLVKPDPRVFALTAERLAVRPEEVLFLDDVEGHVLAARAVGWHAVLHTSTPASIATMEQVLRSGRRPTRRPRADTSRVPGLANHR